MVAKSRNWIFPGFLCPADAAALASVAGCRPSSPASVGLTSLCFAAEGEAACPRAGGSDAEGEDAWVGAAEGERGAAEAAVVPAIAATAAVAAAFASSAAGRSASPGLCRWSQPRCCVSEVWSQEQPPLSVSPR